MCHTSDPSICVGGLPLTATIGSCYSLEMLKLILARLTHEVLVCVTTTSTVELVMSVCARSPVLVTLWTLQSPIRTLKCCLLNARSVVNKSLDVQAYLHSESLDVLAVTETFLSDAISDGELVGSGYSVYRRDRDRHGRGVRIIITDSIAVTRRHDLEMDCEQLWVEIASSPSNLLVGVFYNPPGFKTDTLLHLQNSLASLPNTLPLVLCGDFNLPNIDWNHSSPYPLHLCSSNFVM